MHKINCQIETRLHWNKMPQIKTTDKDMIIKKFPNSMYIKNMSRLNLK